MADNTTQEQMAEAKKEMLGDKSPFTKILEPLKKIVDKLKESGVDINIYRYERDEDIPDFSNINSISKHISVVSNLYIELLGHKLPIYIMKKKDGGAAFLIIARSDLKEYKNFNSVRSFNTRDIREVEQFLIDKSVEIEFVDEMFKTKEDMGLKFNKSKNLVINKDLANKNQRKGHSNG